MKNHTSTLLLVLSSVFLFSCSSSKKSSSGGLGGMNDMVATMQVDEPIEGVCNNDRVIAILPLEGNGQLEADPGVSDREIENMLNEQVSFLNNQADYEDKGMVSIIVNCKGEMVRCEIDNETKNEELDKQIVAVFAKLNNWKAGSIRGESIDTVVLYSFTIEGGKITL